MDGDHDGSVLEDRADPERLARFEREALVEGATLADLVAGVAGSKGPGLHTDVGRVFDSPYVALSHGTGIFHTYAVSADGQRFLIPHSPSSDTANRTMPIAVVVNWAAGLKK
jgi:hypothetical protein